MNVLLIVIMFFVGSAFGSFVNALVYRIRNLLPITYARSQCPNCEHQLAARDLIPLLSYVLLGGRCRYCREPIPIHYPLIELATAVMFAGSFYAYFGLGTLDIGPLNWFSFIAQLFFVVLLMGVLLYDGLYMEIPDKLVLPGIAIAAIIDVVKVVLGSWLFRDMTSRLQFGPQLLANKNFLTGHYVEIASPYLYGAAAGLALAAVFYAIVWLSKERAMGGGDIKLAFLLGLVLPWPFLITAMYIGFLLGAAVGIGWVLTHRKEMHTLIPLAPFLVTGVLVTMLFGDALFRWCLSLKLFG